MFRSVAITLTLCLATVTAQAALLGRAALTSGGTDYQAYYDDVLDITWMADANLADTNNFDVAGIGSNGMMNWTTAQSWIGAMNTANYLGANNWRLPAIIDTGTSGCDYAAYTGTDCGYNVDLTTGEMAHMFYSTLGNTGQYDTNGSATGCSSGPPFCLTSTGPFSNLQVRDYWSGTTYAPYASRAWFFTFFYGAQYYDFKSDRYFVWAVSDGDMLAPVPVPGAVWMFGSALGLFGVMRRKIR